MSDRVQEFTKRFPFLLNLPKDVFVVGGTARFLLGVSEKYPKDIDIRCGNKKTFWATDSYLKDSKAVAKESACEESFPNRLTYLSDELPIEMWFHDGCDSIFEYLKWVPLSRDGCAIRFTPAGEMCSITASDFWGPVEERKGNNIIKTRQYRKHVQEGLLNV